MAQAQSTQLNIRSRFARDRASLLARMAGMTTNQVVDEALRASMPPPALGANGNSVRKGAILVKPANGERMSLDKANIASELTRIERG